MHTFEFKGKTFTSLNLYNDYGLRVVVSGGINSDELRKLGEVRANFRDLIGILDIIDGQQFTISIDREKKYCWIGPVDYLNYLKILNSFNVTFRSLYENL